MYTDQRTVFLLLPEIILALMASWIFLGGTFNRSRVWWGTFSVLTYIVAGIILLRSEAPVWSSLAASGTLPPSGPLAVDMLGQLGRSMAVLAGLLLTLTAMGSARRDLSGEHFGALMIIVVGVMLVARANELVFLFVGLELISIPTYVLLYLGRHDRLSAESAAKYFYLSILSSALLLYGLSFLYGIAGTTLLAGTAETPGIREAFLRLGSGTEARMLSALAPLALILVLAGLGFRIAAVPFHFYAPDVYQGTTQANAGLLAAAPKIAGIVALVRLISLIPPSYSGGWQVTMVLAMLTMTIGNVCALCQKNVRRLLAYSSIAHAGYMLIGISVALAANSPQGSTDTGISSTLFYLYVYVLGALGTFAALAFLRGERGEVNDVEELAGLGRTRPAVAMALAVCMFSLAGIPPLAGFWGKLGLFGDAIRLAAGTEDARLSRFFIALAVIGVLNAAAAAGYYLRIVATMYFYPARRESVETNGAGPFLAMAIAVVLLVSIGLAPGRSIEQSILAGRSIGTKSEPQAVQPSATRAPLSLTLSPSFRAE